jgi:hypothetical protein
VFLPVAVDGVCSGRLVGACGCAVSVLHGGGVG